MRPRTLRSPPVAAEGDTSQEVPQEAEKKHVAPFAAQPSYALALLYGCESRKMTENVKTQT